MKQILLGTLIGIGITITGTILAQSVIEQPLEKSDLNKAIEMGNKIPDEKNFNNPKEVYLLLTEQIKTLNLKLDKIQISCSNQ